MASCCASATPGGTPNVVSRPLCQSDPLGPRPQTVTGSQLGKFHFRSSIAGYPRAALIKHISLCGPSESDVINAALALQHLSNLCRLTVGSGTLPKILASSLAVNSPWADEEDRNKRRRLKIHAEQCEVARLAFLAHRDKFTAVEIVDVSTEMVAALLSTFVGTGLKRLTIYAYNIFRPSHAEQIKGAIQRSVQLSDLHLFDTTSNVSYKDSTWLSDIALYELVALTISLDSRTLATLRSMSSTSPRLTRLTLRVLTHWDMTPGMQPIDLPSLAHLTVLGGGAANSAVALLFLSAPLLTLTIATSRAVARDCQHILPVETPLPPSLGLIHFVYTGPSLPPDLSAYGCTRMAQGIHVSVGWVAEKRSCLQAEYPQWWEKQATDDKDGLPLAQKGRKAVIDSTLRWAMSHAEGLCEREDEVGLKELGEALIRVREVEILARQ